MLGGVRRPPLIAVLVLVLAVLVARRIDAPAPPADAGGRVAAGPGTVLEVLDGDTLVVRMAGYEGPVRIVGVDTPEIRHGDEPAACFGPEAATATAAWLTGRPVVVRPAREQRDRYGRLLAYVAGVDGPLAGRDLARALALSGLARALPIAPNLDDAPAIDERVARARLMRRGLWAACGEARAFPGRG